MIRSNKKIHINLEEVILNHWKPYSNYGNDHVFKIAGFEWVVNNLNIDEYDTQEIMLDLNEIYKNNKEHIDNLVAYLNNFHINNED